MKLTNVIVAVLLLSTQAQAKITSNPLKVTDLSKSVTRTVKLSEELSKQIRRANGGKDLCALLALGTGKEFATFNDEFSDTLYLDSCDRLKGLKFDSANGLSIQARIADSISTEQRKVLMLADIIDFNFFAHGFIKEVDSAGSKKSIVLESLCTKSEFSDSDDNDPDLLCDLNIHNGKISIVEASKKPISK